MDSSVACSAGPSAPPRHRSARPGAAGRRGPRRRSVLAAAAAPLAGGRAVGLRRQKIGDDMERPVAELPAGGGEVGGLRRRVVLTATCSPASARRVNAVLLGADRTDHGRAGRRGTPSEWRVSAAPSRGATTANTLSAVLAAVGDAAGGRPRGAGPAVASCHVPGTGGHGRQQGFLDGLAEWFGSAWSSRLPQGRAEGAGGSTTGWPSRRTTSSGPRARAGALRAPAPCSWTPCI